MPGVNDIESLNELSYAPKIKVYFYPLIVSFFFTLAFINNFPIGTQIKQFFNKNLQGTMCRPNFEEISFGVLLPKVVLSELSLPASCFGRSGNAIKFNKFTINFHFISFAPFGLPFKIETELNEQPLELYFVQGIGSRLVRVKDQSINLNKIQSLIGEDFKISGIINVDISSLINKDNYLIELSLKSRSTNLQIPSQNLQGFTTPHIKLNDFYLEMNSQNPSSISVDKFIVGDPSSPMRANLRGKIDLNSENAAISPIDLNGEVAFTKELKESIPLIDLFFQNYSQKDGFYQIRLGGTLGTPKLVAP